MGKVNQPILAFNRGIISKLGLARIDVSKVLLAAEDQVNWTPRLLGSMMLRPGLEYIGSSRNNNKAIYIPFIFSRSQTARIEFTDSYIRVRTADDQLITRPAVSSTITNGNFAGSLTGWTDNDAAGTTSQWVPGDYMQLVGNGLSYARRTQQVTNLNPGILHAVRIVIQNGPVKFRIGTTALNDDIFPETNLGTGTHSLGFIPAGNFYINLFSPLKRITLVKSIEIEAAGVMELPSPYVEEDLSLIRWDQSLDVIYLAGASKQQRKLERRDNDSWSIVLYQPEDGPVKAQNTTPIAITASGLNGNITLTSNQNLFKAGQVGGIYKLISIGQSVSSSISSEDTFTNTIEVEGIGVTRQFTIIRQGTWVATVTLQRSFDSGTSWLDVTTYTNNATITFNDGLDNQVVLYRIGIKTGNYTSGTVDLSLSYSQGSITGYARLTAFSSATSVSAEVLKDLGSTTATTKWSQGEWSDDEGWPSTVALAEGRLFDSGLGKVWGSISDAYDSYDDEVEGDSGTISKFLGAGAISTPTWMISLYRLFIGCDTAVKAVKTSAFEDPMTPTNFRVVEPSTQACADIPAAKLDKKALFAQGAGTRVYELSYDESSIDYAAVELTKACPEIGLPGIIRIAVQRQPDTFIHCVRSDGKVAVLIYDQLEDLKAWFLYETDGEVEDVITFPGPGTVEDLAYYSVKRTINGQTVRYFEKFAFQIECEGGTLNKQADSFKIYDGSPTTTISGLDHLEAKEVVVWADGKDFSPGTTDQTTFLVTGGQITLPSAVSQAVVGLPYSAYYKSAKLAYASGSPLGQKKKLNAIGVIIINTHNNGLQYSSGVKDAEGNIIYDDMPRINPNTGAKVDRDYIYDYLDSSQVSLAGSWFSDTRLYLAAQAPRPVTLSGCEIAQTTNDKQ
jgi:hypothetical protein